MTVLIDMIRVNVSRRAFNALKSENVVTRSDLIQLKPEKIWGASNDVVRELDSLRQFFGANE